MSVRSCLSLQCDSMLILLSQEAFPRDEQAMGPRADSHLITNPPNFAWMRKTSRFEELFLPHLDAAYSLARWIVGRDQDAQEVVQEAYARALKGFSGFRGENPRAWLLTIVHNTACGWSSLPIDEEKLMPFEEDADAVPTEVLFSELSHERRLELLTEALNRLPSKFREVLFLCEIERWSYKAIAAALNVPLETVMSRLKGARRRMRQELTQVREREIEESR
jgi:RNA polymerase sigma-70 factor, ECF subfamily